MIQEFEILDWFGAMIAQPLQRDQKLSDCEEEANIWIAPSPKLKPQQRLQIYHQQYWWRLLKCLQDNFPTATRLFGYENFNHKSAIPYLKAYPPSHWALNKLGENFPQWLEKNYHEENRYLVVHSAYIDWAANESFLAGHLPKVDFASLTPMDTLNQPLILQPHIHLFSLEGDLFTFREEFLKNPPEHYNLNSFPRVTYGNFHFVLYRSPENMVSWKQISHAEMVALALFKQGNTIDQVCAALEEQGGELFEEALSQIPFWFKQWTVLSWFGRPSLS